METNVNHVKYIVTGKGFSQIFASQEIAESKYEELLNRALKKKETGTIRLQISDEEGSTTLQETKLGKRHFEEME